MGVSYDLFCNAFLSKITEFELLQFDDVDRTSIVDGYLKRAIISFKKNCAYDFVSTANDETREFEIEVKDEDIDELVEIISEGMVVQWIKPYINNQEILQNVLNTKDFTTYSPAELLMRIGNAYNDAKKSYIQMIREYSYNHGDLTNLHL